MGEGEGGREESEKRKKKIGKGRLVEIFVVAKGKRGSEDERSRKI